MMQNSIFSRRLLLPLMLFATLSGCGDTPGNAYAQELKAALRQFTECKDAAIKLLKASHELLTGANVAGFKAESDEVKEFRSQWKTARSEVSHLRTRYEDLIKKADFHFAFVEGKIASITTLSLRDQLTPLVTERRAAFVAAARGSQEALIALEDVVKRGDDIVAALDVINAIETVNDETVQLLGLMAEADKLVPTLDEMVNAGTAIVELKLESRP